MELVHTAERGAALDNPRRSSVGVPLQPRILVADYDHAIRGVIRSYLIENGFQVDVAAERKEMAKLLSDQRYNLLLLELNLGPDDELGLLHEARLRSDLPLIVLTSHRQDETDRIVSLELGADDYLTKPISLRELLARVRTILRRVALVRAAAAREIQAGRDAKPCGWRFCRFGGWSLDRRARRLLDPRGHQVTLTNNEFGLLVVFLEAPQLPLSREQLIQGTRMHEDIYDRSIDVQILRLRRKLCGEPCMQQMIQTIRGLGYIFALPVEHLSGSY